MPREPALAGRRVDTAPSRIADFPRWPGLDRGFAAEVAGMAGSPSSKKFERALETDLAIVRGKISPFGRPERIRPEYTARLRVFVAAYHRAIQTIIAASSTDVLVRNCLSLPPDLQEELDGDRDSRNGYVHLCRLDLLLDASGGFHVLETNANCPGALLSTGVAGRYWRERLASRGFALPAALEQERPSWMADWFLRAARAASTHSPDFVALFREDGGNRLELSGLSRQLSDEGVEAIEIDPRHVRLSGRGVPSIGGRHVHHGYLKLKIQRLRHMRSELAPFLTAVRRRSLFVQNGLRGRLVGDNKLCLAILSDRSFDYLFDPADLELLRPHVPWSRPVAACPAGEMERIRSGREDFVLKSPLDTQGRGVLIGREVANQKEWERGLDLAVRRRWLVQQFCTTTQMLVDPVDGAAHLHDLSLGVVGGRLAGAMIRSSRQLRTNVALTGRLHPVFM